MDNDSSATTNANILRSPLRHKLVGDICGVFFVPGYQRGYRWDTADVKRLLDDIWESEDKAYNLQPIVVKLHQSVISDQEHQWELIDGQQRLTTLYLIFLYMQKAGLKNLKTPYELHYQTRPDSQTYLKTLDPDQHLDNIDYYHLYKAYECIGQWFEAHGQRRQYAADKFYGSLFEKVRIIWYEAPPDVDSTALFTRLNVGRIPLTDAELVKALMLSRIHASQTPSADELAAQWDIIERDLHDPDVWAFVAGGHLENHNDQYPTRISLLLDTLAPPPPGHKPGRTLPRYHAFETLREQIETTPLEFWSLVLSLHALILGWFNNRSLYHKIGFLVATGNAFCELVKLAKDQKKSQFESLLDTRIRHTLNTRESELEALSYENKNEYKKLTNLLLLMNVETLRRTEHSTQRFPFRLHASTAWSLEHIHAQNAENLTTTEQWRVWLQQHQMAISVLAPETIPEQSQLLDDIETALREIETARNFGTTFQNLVARVISAFNAPDTENSQARRSMHSISNLALLSRADNSLLSNSVFEVKRQNVLKVDRQGRYIPVCTRNVFLKYYTSSNAQQIHFWSLQDRESYLDAITSTVAKYLKTDEQNS